MDIRALVPVDDRDISGMHIEINEPNPSHMHE